MQTNFSSNLKAIREKCGLNIKQLSDQMELTRETIYDWEAGRSVPTLPNLVKLANFFGVSLDKLVYG